VYYLPWWVILACLAASALAAYLVLRGTQTGDSPWALLPLTAALAPVVLLGAMVAAITLSTLLSALLLEDRTGTPADASESPARTERTRSPTTIVDKTHGATTEEQTTTTATAIPTPTATSTATATASP
jgi:lysylphosphatidylglycerol synthetase-like protein (DUF2156 family)